MSKAKTLTRDKRVANYHAQNGAARLTFAQRRRADKKQRKQEGATR